MRQQSGVWLPAIAISFIIAGCSNQGVQVPSGFNSHGLANIQTTGLKNSTFKTQEASTSYQLLTSRIISQGKKQGFEKIEIVSHNKLILRGRLNVIGEEYENPITVGEIGAAIVLVPATLFELAGIPLLEPALYLTAPALAPGSEDFQAKFVSAIAGIIEFEAIEKGTRIEMNFNRLVYEYDKGEFDFSAFKFGKFDTNDYKLISQRPIEDPNFYRAMFLWVLP